MYSLAAADAKCGIGTGVTGAGLGSALAAADASGDAEGEGVVSAVAAGDAVGEAGTSAGAEAEGEGETVGAGVAGVALLSARIAVEAAGLGDVARGEGVGWAAESSAALPCCSQPVEPVRKGSVMIEL